MADKSKILFSNNPIFKTFSKIKSIEKASQSMRFSMKILVLSHKIDKKINLILTNVNKISHKIWILNYLEIKLKILNLSYKILWVRITILLIAIKTITSLIQSHPMSNSKHSKQAKQIPFSSNQILIQARKRLIFFKHWNHHLQTERMIIWFTMLKEYQLRMWWTIKNLSLILIAVIINFKVSIRAKKKNHSLSILKVVIMKLEVKIKILREILLNNRTKIFQKIQWATMRARKLTSVWIS